MCISCNMDNETQEHIWLCRAHQASWQSILDLAAERCFRLLQQLHTPTIPSKVEVLQLMHESRTFIIKGIVSNNFFELIHSVARSIPTAYHIIAQVYNLIYSQVFTLIWKPRCKQVIDHEHEIGINNCNKCTKHPPRQRPTVDSVNPLRPRTSPAQSEVLPLLPWVKWFTASIRHGATWLTHAYTTQADRFSSFTTSALNSFTCYNNHRLNRTNNRLDRVPVISCFFSV